MNRVLSLVFVTLLSVSALAQQGTFRQEFVALRQDFRNATQQKDYGRIQQVLLKMNELIPGRPDTFYMLACAHALTGNKTVALNWLEKFAATGAVRELAKDPDLASLTSEPRFKAAQQRIEANRVPVTHSTATFTLKDPGLLVEDIAYDSRTRSFFATSILKKKIIRIDGAGRQSDFADFSRDPNWPIMAVHADSARNTLWATASAMPDFIAAPPAHFGKTLLLKLDLRSGKILQRVAPPDNEQRSFGDMDVAPNGSVVVTDSRGGAVYLLRPGATTLERLDHGEFMSPQTPAITPDSRYAYVADYARGIARIDLRSRTVTWLKHAETVAITGIDGLVLDSTNKKLPRLIAVQNGFTPVRISLMTLNGPGDSIEKLDILETGYPELGDPTHAVLAGDDLYFIANSGWSFLDDHGNLQPGQTMTPATIRKLHLP